MKIGAQSLEVFTDMRSAMMRPMYVRMMGAFHDSAFG